MIMATICPSGEEDRDFLPEELRNREVAHLMTTSALLLLGVLVCLEFLGCLVAESRELLEVIVRSRQMRITLNVKMIT